MRGFSFWVSITPCIYPGEANEKSEHTQKTLHIKNRIENRIRSYFFTPLEYNEKADICRSSRESVSFEKPTTNEICPAHPGKITFSLLRY